MSNPKYYGITLDFHAADDAEALALMQSIQKLVSANNPTAKKYIVVDHDNNDKPINLEWEEMRKITSWADEEQSNEKNI